MCFRSFQISTIRKRFGESLVYGGGWGRRKGKLVGQLVVLVGRNADDAGEVDLLLREIIFKSGQALAFGLLLHETGAYVNLRDETRLTALLGLLEESSSGFKLCPRRLDASVGGNGLQVCAASGENDQVACVLYGLLVSPNDFAGGAVVVDGGHISDGLSESGAQIEIVKRTNNGWKLNPLIGKLMRKPSARKFVCWTASRSAPLRLGSSTLRDTRAWPLACCTAVDIPTPPKLYSSERWTASCKESLPENGGPPARLPV